MTGPAGGRRQALRGGLLLFALGLGFGLALAVSGCGGRGTETVTVTETVAPPTTTEPQPRNVTLRLYFLREDQVVPIAREVRTASMAKAALRALIAGPKAGERSDLGLDTAIPAGAKLVHVALEGGVARVRLRGDYSDAALAQVVYTATQFPTVRAVEIDGRRLARADFEDLTPSILVESPLPFDHVRGRVVARGTANTFEATFAYELTDADGRTLASDFVTASSGSGARGTFDFTVPFSVDRSGLGTLSVFERSAENGKRIHIVQIPLYLDR